MAWWDEIEGRVNGVMDKLEAREKAARARRVEKRRRAALFATPMRRMTALLVDVVVIYVLLGSVLSFLNALLPPFDYRAAALFLNDSAEGLRAGRYDLGMVWTEAWRLGYIPRILFDQCLQIFLLGLAVVPALWRWQCTLGMRVAGLRLYRKDRFVRPGFLRCLGFFLAGVATLMTGYLLMIFTRDRRALHDILSGTAVLRTKEVRERDAAEKLLAADAAAEAAILAEAEEKAAEREAQAD